MRRQLDMVDGFEGNSSLPDEYAPSRRLQDIKDSYLENQVQAVVADTITTPTDYPAGAPSQLLSVSATESPTIAQSKTVSQVSVSFTYDTTDDNFAGVRIWFTGYKGSTTPTLMAQGTTSPVTFLCETTGETVIVTAQAAGANGTPAPFDGSPTTSVLLDGVISAPPSPSISQSLVTYALGFQFSFNQINLGGTQDVIDCYRVYRNTSNTFAGASLIRTVPHDPTATGAIVIQDNVGAAKTYYYFVTAVNTVGLESTSVAAQSGAVTTPSVSLDSEVADGSAYKKILSGAVVAGIPKFSGYGNNLLFNPLFTQNASGSTANTNLSSGSMTSDGWFTPAISAKHVVQWQTGTTNNVFIRVPSGTLLPALSGWYETDIRCAANLDVIAGRKYRLLAHGTVTNGGVGGASYLYRTRVKWLSNTGSFISEDDIQSLTGTTGAVTHDQIFTAPANASQAQVEMCGFINNTTGSPITTTGNLDYTWTDCSFFLVSDLDNEVQDGTTYGRLQAGDMTGNRVDFSKSLLNKHLDNMPDGSSRFSSRYDNTSYIVESALYNGSFEAFPTTQTVADGWEANFEAAGTGATFARSGTAKAGSVAQSIISNGTNSGSVGSRAFPVKQGAKYTIGAWVSSTVANPGTCYIRVCWYNDDSNLTKAGAASSNDIVSAGGPTLSNTYQYFSAEFIAPAGAKYARIALYNWTGTACTLTFDAVRCYFSTIDLDNVADGSTYGRWWSTTARDAAVDSSGNIRLKNLVNSDGITANPTTASTSFATMPEMTSTITTKGNKVMVIFTNTFTTSTNNSSCTFAVFRDGSQISQAYQIFSDNFGRGGGSISFIDTGASAASHTYTIQWKSPSGTVTVTSATRSVQVVELG